MLTKRDILLEKLLYETSDETDFIGTSDETGFTGTSDEIGFTGTSDEPEMASEPRDIISELQRKISDLKEEITEKLKPLYPEDKDKDLAEALDDATSALDLASHHLTDVDNSLSGSSDEPGIAAEPDTFDPSLIK